MRKLLAVLAIALLALPAFALSNRRNTLLVNSGNRPAFAAGYMVTAYDVGGLVASSSSGTTITLHAGHGFAVNDKLMVGTNTSKFRTVTVVTGTTQITVNGAVSVSSGDYLINLGNDTGSVGPLYDGSTVTAYSDMAGDGTYTNAKVTTDAQGVYTYWFSVSNLWELVRNTTGAPVAIIPEVNQTGSGGGGGGSPAFSAITSGTSTNVTMTVGNASIITTSGSGSVQATSVPGSGVSGAVATATALAANGANCTSPAFPLGVDASGAAETCTTVLLPTAASMNTGVAFTASNFGVQYTASDTNPTCSAGVYGIFADLSETKLKKCTNGVATDMDTTGGTPTFDTVGSGTNTTATMVCGSGCSATVSGTGIREATKFKGSGTTTDAVDLGTAEVAGTLAQSNGGTGATSFTAGRVIFEGTGGAFSQDADLTFDGTQTLTSGTFSSPDQDGTNALTVIGNTSPLGAASSGQARYSCVGRTTSCVPHFRDNATGDEQILTTNRAATAGSASALTFAAAASFAVPSAAAETPAAAGQIAVDQTSNQLKYYGTALQVIPPVDQACAVIENLAAADDAFEFWMTNVPVTITSAGCYCRGTCTTTATITLADRGGNAMTISGTPLACAKAGANATYQAVTAANQLVAGEGIAFTVSNTPNPDATDEYTICVTYTTDAN